MDENSGRWLLTQDTTVRKIMPGWSSTGMNQSSSRASMKQEKRRPGSNTSGWQKTWPTMKAMTNIFVPKDAALDLFTGLHKKAKPDTGGIRKCMNARTVTIAENGNNASG